jgi:hypothetical protein
MRELLAEFIRFVGWIALEAATVGRYERSESSNVLLEGVVAGLSVKATVMCAAYAWWPA